MDIETVKKEVAAAVRKMYPSASPEVLDALIRLHLGYELWFILTRPAGVKS